MSRGFAHFKHSHEFKLLLVVLGMVACLTVLTPGFATLQNLVDLLGASAFTGILAVGLLVVLITGGTGFTGRDSTPEAVSCLLDKQVDGFGELFRQISVPDIGTSTIQSRALAGLANGTLVCCLPGSTNACRTAYCYRQR